MPVGGRFLGLIYLNMQLPISASVPEGVAHRRKLPEECHREGIGIVGPIARFPDDATVERRFEEQRWGTEAPESPRNLTLPPIDATPEEITEALFRLKPEGEAEKPAARRIVTYISPRFLRSGRNDEGARSPSRGHDRTALDLFRGQR